MESDFHKKIETGKESPIVPDRDTAIALLTFFMRLRLFYRGEKEYRLKKNIKKFTIQTAKPKTKTKKKKRKEEKRNFDSIFMTTKHLLIHLTPFTCGNTKLPILILGLEVH